MGSVVHRKSPGVRSAEANGTTGSLIRTGESPNKINYGHRGTARPTAALQGVRISTFGGQEHPFDALLRLTKAFGNGAKTPPTTSEHPKPGRRRGKVRSYPAKTAGHVRQVMREHGVSCMPVVDSDQQPVGIVTATDLLNDYPDTKPLSQFITDKVYTVPRYGDVSLAARIMRNHGIHHVVVTEEQKVVGIISSYDLLKLVEGHRFVMKNAPTQSKKASGKRRKSEVLDQND